MRHRLIDRLDMLMRAAVQPGLILVDLDGFKALNDGFGPAIGDTLLCRVAARLQSVVPDPALIARVSGGGFGILLREGAGAGEMAPRLLDFISRPFAINGLAITTSVCVGVSIGGRDGVDGQAVFHAADVALHQAQREGRNRVCQFDPSMHLRATERQMLDNDFRAAISLHEVELLRSLKSQQFEVHYQPKQSLVDGRITGFEALLRWHHPDHGHVSPDKLIPLAEEAGLIGLIGEWVMRQACKDAVAWQPSKNGEFFHVAVNVSPLQLRNGGGLLVAIRNALDESGLAPERLELELTETALAGDVCGTIAAIRGLGVKLTLDDFGMGYSSLSRLQLYPFSRLKIDKSFISGMVDGSDSEALQANERMIGAIAALGIGLGLETVMEGVETHFQYDVARRAGCTEVQGYLVSPAVPGTAVADLVVRIENAQ